MTIEERDNIKDRDRIKQYLENSMRRLCDFMCDEPNPTQELSTHVTKCLMDYSTIYKNMGFDVEHHFKEE